LELYPSTKANNSKTAPNRNASHAGKGNMAATSGDNAYNISVEGVQVVMPKEEIDEESLARRIGWDIVNKIKASMDNQVVTG
jgi:hypothetical protein